jgi:hypothetical protein
MQPPNGEPGVQGGLRAMHGRRLIDETEMEGRRTSLPANFSTSVMRSQGKDCLMPRRGDGATGESRNDVVTSPRNFRAV